MDIKQVNSTPSQPAPVRTSPGVNGRSQASKPSLWLMIIGLLVLVALVGAGLWWLLGSKVSGTSDINKDAYQAVFLTNGQVYFGKLKSVAGKYATMENIYYLQVEQAVQPSTENPAQGADPENNVQLIKLGNELHGPEDKMHISSDQILFWENLKDESKISKAIGEYKE